jgi:predicted dehydrogenase
MSSAPVRVGVVGCGAISNAYFTAKQVFPILDIAACADLVPERAAAKAKEHGIARALSVDELLADPQVEVVLNLTVPKAHADLNCRALAAGKHVYVEKPLGISRAEGRRTMQLAQRKGLRVGCAPDTFMGDGIQTCRRLVDSGAIGQPLGATAYMMCHGHESWHPSPEFYYEVGGGPVFDMGPYYLTALVNLIGPVARVGALARTTFPTRTITSEAKRGKIVPVETPTHITGLLDFANGATGALTMSFDVWRHRHSCIELYGTEGSLLVPDPNGFAGKVFLAKAREDFVEIPLSTGHPEYQRGAGLADMAYAIRSGRPHRASGELAYHVLDIMAALVEGGERGGFRKLTTTTTRPAAIPDGLATGTLER